MFHKNPSHIPSEVKNLVSKDAERFMVAAKSSLQDTSTNKVESLSRNRESGKGEQN